MRTTNRLRSSISSSSTTAKARIVSRVLMLCVLVALLAIPGATVPAQSQDQLQEKLDLLKEKLERYLSHSYEVEGHPEIGNVTFEAVNFETCKISWKISSEFGRGSDVPMIFRDVRTVNYMSVNLSSIDAARTRIYSMKVLRQNNVPWSLALELNVRPGSPGFTTQMMVNKAGRVTHISVQDRQAIFLFNFRDQQVAEDVSRAFADASTICRSRTQRRR